jgi:hypothetical protein
MAVAILMKNGIVLMQCVEYAVPAAMNDDIVPGSVIPSSPPFS